MQQYGPHYVSPESIAEWSARIKSAPIQFLPDYSADVLEASESFTVTSPDFTDMRGSFEDWTIADCLWYFQTLNWTFRVDGDGNRVSARQDNHPFS